MKRTVILWVSYILVLSLLGIAVLQYYFIRNQKYALQNQFEYLVTNSLSDLDTEIKMIQLKNLLPEIDTLGISMRSYFADLFPMLNETDSCEGESVIPRPVADLDELLDSLEGKNTFHAHDTVYRKFYDFWVEYSYQSFNKILEAKPLSERISIEDLKKITDDIFAQNNIHIPYEFAVFHNGSETNIKTRQFKTGDDYLVVSHPLFDAYSSHDKYEIKVAFRKKDLHKKNMFIFQLLSYVLTGLLLISFLVTIYNMMKQKHLSELKNDFINNITHEFKTPIATMALAIDSMKSPHIMHDPEKIKYYLKILKEENQRMLKQVEKILFLSKLEQGEVIWKKQLINVHDVIQEALNHLDLILKSKSAKVNLELNAQKPYVEGDPFFLFDAFVNLLDNAVKYSYDNVEITIKTFNKKNYIVIQIADKGVGMPRHVTAHIFEKFYRKPTGDVHNVAGHGIGLTFVKQVIKKMNGEIFVDSEVGKGTVFTIYLPLAEPEDAEAENKKKSNNPNK